MKKWTLKKEGDWNAVVKTVSSEFKDGDVLAISGVLGAGKTTFVQHFARTLGAKKEAKSPTFALMREYAIRSGRLLHVDAYRIENERDLLALNLDEELLVPGTMLVIEWPENIPSWLEKKPHKGLEIILKGNDRSVTFTP